MPFQLLDLVGAKSKQALAARIRAAWVELAPGDDDDIPSVVSIANRLGDLETDKPSWWQSEKRPAAAQAFERVTGIPLWRLTAPRDVVVSPDFARLRELHPRAEEVPVLDAVGWTEPPEGKRWIVSRPGAGARFIAQIHRIRGTAHVVEASRLADVASLPQSSVPLLVIVQGANATRDGIAATALLTRSGPVMIVAPHPPPPECGRWPTTPWYPVAGWRKTLVEWAAARVSGETLLDAGQLLKWLGQVDRDEALFATPADVLGLCAVVDEDGPPSSRKDVPRTFLDLRVEQEAKRHPEIAHWLRAWARPAVLALVDALLDTPGRNVTDALDRTTWATLLPPQIAPPPLGTEDVEALLDAKKGSRKELVEKLLRRSGAETIEILTTAGLLRPQGSGLALDPRWVVVTLARARIRGELVAGRSRVWGRWAVERTLAPLVDAELDALTHKEQGRMARELSHDFDATVLGSVGALEATFAAIGRSIGQGTHASDDLTAIAERQLTLLTTRFENAPPAFPLTRGWEDTEGSWLACGWAWSLHAPVVRVPLQLGWLFPGWTSSDHASMENASFFTGEGSGGGGFEQILTLAPELVERLARAAAPEETVLDVLLPEYVLRAHRDEPPWRLPNHGLDHLLGSPWAGEHLARRAAVQPSADRVAIAQTLWNAALRNAGAVAAVDLFRRVPALLDFIGAELPELDFERALREPDRARFFRIREVPARFRARFAKHAAEGAGPVIAGWGRPSLGAEDAEWLEVLVDHGGPPWAFDGLWRAAPERARAKLAKLDLGEPAAATLFFTSPEWLLGELLEQVTAARRPWPAWVGMWLRRGLAEAGAGAERVFRMIGAIEQPLSGEAAR